MALNPDDLSPEYLFDILDAVAVRRTRPFVKRFYPADTVRIGCGKATCQDNAPWGSGAWEIWVCNYDPPGNWVGEKPY